MKYAVVALLALLALSSTAQFTRTPAQIEDMFTAEVVAYDLRVPWDLELAPDGHTVWMTERDGSISTVDMRTGKRTLVHWEEETYETQENSGMHSLALHPNFDQNGWVYVHYCYAKYDSKLVRYTYRGGALENREELRKFKANTSHNGSRLVWDDEGALFMTIGDAYTRDEFPQDTTHVNGKVLRMDENGGAFPGNPIPDNPVWTIGHRNPQGMCFGPGGQLYISEHGPDTDDEFNVVERFRNYGWPLVLGACDTPEKQHICDSLNVREPLLVWNPTMAVAGMSYCQHPDNPLRGNILVGTLKSQTLLQVNPNANYGGEWQSRPLFAKQFGRLRDVIELPDGSLLLCTSNMEIVAGTAKRPNDDKLIRLYRPDVQSAYRSAETWTQAPFAAIQQEPDGRVRAKQYFADKATVLVQDLSGQVWAEQALPNGEAFRLENTEAPQGVYVVQILDGQEVISVEKVVLRRTSPRVPQKHSPPQHSWAH